MRSSEELCSVLRETGYFDELELRILRAMLVLRQKKRLRVTAAAIARQAGMPVTNTYKYLYALQLKGVVESNKDKNKIFWLSQSANPFPRLLGLAAQEFTEKRELFSEAESKWEKMIPQKKTVWAGERVYEHYDNGFMNRAAFLFDVARSSILITAPKFFKDMMLLEALSRGAQRGVRIRFLTEEVDSKITKKLRDAGIQLRLGRAWPYMVLVDDVHGMTSETEGKGLWFLNHANHKIKQHFEQLWERAQEM